MTGRERDGRAYGRTRPRHWLGGLAGLASGLLLAGAVAAKPVDFLFVAGDSLSDTGNVSGITRALSQALPGAIEPIPATPPYVDGRFSNGPLWIERLAARLELQGPAVRNVALGGARTSGHTAIDAAPPFVRPVLESAGIGGLKQQVDVYLAAGGRVSPDGLYVLWAGANDYLFGPPPAVLDGVPEPVAQLRSAVADLADAGARHFLVPNLPDLGRIPSTSGEPDQATALSAASDAHNLALPMVLAEAAASLQIDVQILDVAAYFDAAFAGTLGFANVTTPCIDAPETCGTSLFFDGLHPTTAAHMVLGDLAYQVVTPLPPAVLMFGAALAGLGWMARRRRQAA